MDTKEYILCGYISWCYKTDKIIYAVRSQESGYSWRYRPVAPSVLTMFYFLIQV